MTIQPRRWYTPILTGDLTQLWPAIVILFGGVLLVAFGLSYHGLFTFARVVLGWPTPLAAVAPLGLDVFSMLALVATMLTATAALRRRAYCWAAFLATVALSVAANGIAAWVVVVGPDDAAAWLRVSALVGAAIWPALAAVALHLLIVVRRHLDESAPPPTRVRQSAPPPPDPAARKSAPPPDPADPADRRAVIAAARAADPAAGPSTIADATGIPRSSVQHYWPTTAPVPNGHKTGGPHAALRT